MNTGTANLSTASIVGQVYAASKYDIKLLLDECIEYIQKNAQDVFQSEELLSAPRSMLCSFFECGCRGKLIDPYACYVAAKKWAVHQIKREKEKQYRDEGSQSGEGCLKNVLKRKSKIQSGNKLVEEVEQVLVEDEVATEERNEMEVSRKKIKLGKYADDENKQVIVAISNEEDISDSEEIRKVLGGVLDLIRFRDMPLQYFISRVANENILPECTKLSIISHINSKQHLMKVDVCNSIDSDCISKMEGEVNFCVSTFVQLTGVSLFLPKKRGEEVSGELKLSSKGNNILLEQNISIRGKTRKKFENIVLENKVSLEPNVIYTALVVYDTERVDDMFEDFDMYLGTHPVKSQSKYGFTIAFTGSKCERTPPQNNIGLIKGLTFEF